MEARDIFERNKLGEEISHQDPEYHKIREMIDEAQKLLFELISIMKNRRLDVYFLN